MKNKEKVKNTEENLPIQEQLPLGLKEPEKKIKFRSKYTALISLLKADLDSKSYKKEVAILNQIVKLGFTTLQINAAWNYYQSKNQKFNSFAIFLWNKGKLIRDILPLLEIKEDAQIIVDEAQDFRESKDYTPAKSKIDFLK